MVNQLHVNGGHCHEEIVGALHSLCAQLFYIELRHEMDGCTCPQGAAENIDNTVNMMQRQKKRNNVMFRPGPGVNECCDLSFYIFVGRHNAFGQTCGAAGKDDQSPSIS